MKVFCAAIVLASVFIAGCAAPSQVRHSTQSEVALWRGRLALRVESEQPQSFSSGFELSGNSLTGALTLFTPMGTTAGALSWSPQAAFLHSNGEVRSFESLDELMKQTLGTELPVAALFAWLAGHDLEVAGWRTDLSQHASGRISARRMAPWSAELRLVLD